VAALAALALQDEDFRGVVSTISYASVIKDKKGVIYKRIWSNTNKLLERGFNGVKTGNTPTAGFFYHFIFLKKILKI
jgi:hypothetical protein